MAKKIVKIRGSKKVADHNRMIKIKHKSLSKNMGFKRKAGVNKYGQRFKSKSGKKIMKSPERDKLWRAKPPGKRYTTNPHRWRGKTIRSKTAYYENRGNRSDSEIDRGRKSQNWHKFQKTGTLKDY